MNGMSVGERVEDISRRSGMSEEIVRRVLKAEAESVKVSLKKGERATLIGRCTIIPSIRQKLGVNCSIDKSIKLSARVASSLESELREMESFEESDDDIDKIAGVSAIQIASLE